MGFGIPFQSAWNQASDAIKQKVAQVATKAEQVFNKAVDKAEDIAKKAEQKAKDTAKFIAAQKEKIKNAVKNEYKKVETAITNQFSKAVEKAKQLAEKAKQKAKKSLEKAEQVANAAKQKAISLGKKVKNTYKKIKEKFSPTNFIKKAIELCPLKKAQNWLTSDDKARKYINSLNNQQIASLSTQEKTRLLKELLDGHFSKDDKEAFQKLAFEGYFRRGYFTDVDKEAQKIIYQNMPLTDEFEKFNKTRMKELADKLKNEPLVVEANNRWNDENYNETQKKAALQKIIDIQSEVYGFPKTTLIVTKLESPKGLITSGEFRPSDKQIYLNNDPKADFSKSFRDAVFVSTHENAHRYQDFLAEKSQNNEIKSNDPTFQQAIIFKTNNTEPNGYIRGEVDFETYQNQPLEKHSNIVGKYISGKIDPPSLLEKLHLVP